MVLHRLCCVIWWSDKTNRQDDLGILGYDSVAGSVVTDILKDRFAFTFIGQKIHVYVCIYHMNNRHGGPQNQSEHFGEEEDLLPHPWIQPQFVQLMA